MAKLFAKRSGDGGFVELAATDDGELKVLLYGVQSDGTVTPVLVDAAGKIVLST